MTNQDFVTTVREYFVTARSAASDASTLAERESLRQLADGCQIAINKAEQGKLSDSIMYEALNRIRETARKLGL